MAFGAFVGAGFEVAAGGVAAFGVNFVAAESAVGPCKENARCDAVGGAFDSLYALATDV